MGRPRKPYKRLKFEDRKMIEALDKEGRTIDEMALLIGVNYATIRRELQRGGEPYSAEVAQNSL